MNKIRYLFCDQNNRIV